MIKRYAVRVEFGRHNAVGTNPQMPIGKHTGFSEAMDLLVSISANSIAEGYRTIRILEVNEYGNYKRNDGSLNIVYQITQTKD